MTRVGGKDICADFGTKHLDYQTMNKQLKFMLTAFCRKAGARLHPNWNSFSTSTPIETNGSPHSATPRHELATGKFAMETLAERSELQLALDSDVAKKCK